MSIYLKEKKTLEKLKRERAIIHWKVIKNHSECAAVIAFLKKQTGPAVWNVKESCVRAGWAQGPRAMGSGWGAGSPVGGAPHSSVSSLTAPDGAREKTTLPKKIFLI